MTEGLRKRTRPGTFIPRAVLRDRRLSFRARGILAHLLDRPAGWDVRAEALAAESDHDGRDKILSALRELGIAGYYRLERRRLGNGQFAMGTAISEEPVEEWAADYAEYGGRAVPVIQQPDGSFLVKHKDGSLTPDGFSGGYEDESGPGSPGDDSPPDGGSPGTSEVYDHLFSQVTPGTDFPASVKSVPDNPVPGNPEPGSPGSGEPVAIRRTDNEEPKRTSRTEPASQAQYGHGRAAPHPGPSRKSGSRATVERTAEQQARFNIATEIADKWWAYWTKTRNVPIVGKKKYPALRDSIILAALEAGYARQEVQEALKACDEPLPHITRFQDVLRRRRTGEPPKPWAGRSQPSNLIRQPGMAAEEQERVSGLFSGVSVAGRRISNG